MLKNRRPENRFSTAAKRQRIYVDNGRPDILSSEYPLRLNFYLNPPPAEITIEEFEQFALDRLQVLKSLENATLRNKRGPDLKREIDQVLENHMPLRSNLTKSSNLYDERRKDHVSHYVLRMAYCRSEDLREWFSRQECALFKYRFEQETMEDKKRFLANLDLNWKILDQNEKKDILSQLESCAGWAVGKAVGHSNVKEHVNNETYFEVDFEKVPDLVSRRAVYVRNGKAYVPMSEQISVIMDEFRAQLSRALEATSKALPRMEEDDRLKPILLNVEKQYVGKTYNDTENITGSIKAEDVDPLIQRHAPLCMRNLHESLRANNHLRYGGRMQYGLFLKAVGLPIEEALLFWRKAFANITDDKFQKEYAYNIRHNYGLEGKRANYSPYSCIKIIQGDVPSTGDHHGCPFRNFSIQNLEARLYKDRITTTHINEIVNLVQEKHYQVACSRYFEVTHPERTEKSDTIQHPNQYFEMSRGKIEMSEQRQGKNEEMDVDQ
ncbi:hypothetical protein DFQ28_007551 [Apophysomyces sp. BC1034]|nr:hypothetical protein DFQ30_007350 [Apophysomyces sp. BC1015]KAG0176245.1 hypothetical protein DFQ29_006384 [Apophysomyces sp. BC1021]KAG0186597.1 hypothetical protein DFQ28_007551 [Apophysomyces sp. BC1034]